MTTKLTVHSLEPMLTDSLVLVDIAEETGMQQDKVRAVLARLYDLPIDQVIRMCQAAHGRHVTAVNRQSRKGERR